MEETSLADFTDGTEERARGPTDQPGTGAESPDDPASDDAEAAPTVTAGWSPEGAACGVCGERAAWRWRTEAGLVCRDCKDW